MDEKIICPLPIGSRFCQTYYSEILKWLPKVMPIGNHMILGWCFVPSISFGMQSSRQLQTHASKT